MLDGYVDEHDAEHGAGGAETFGDVVYVFEDEGDGQAGEGCRKYSGPGEKVEAVVKATGGVERIGQHGNHAVEDAVKVQLNVLPVNAVALRQAVAL